MSGTCTLMKRAFIRDRAIPIGVPAPLHVECCGNKIPQAMPPIIAGTVCPSCGTIYDVGGWITGNAHGKKGQYTTGDGKTIEIR